MSRPNIVLVLMDDLGWRDLGCYGSSFYETPCLDQLAAEGLRFTDAYASCPVCSPTRASVLTGRYPARVGVTQFIGGHTVGRLCDVPYFHCLPLSEYSLARALKELGGYQTWHVGKWHLGGHLTTPEKHGFDLNIGGCEWGYPVNGYFSPWGLPTLEDGPDREYLTDRLTDEAIRLIETSGHEPFFLNFWPYAVHTPIEAPEPMVEKYRVKARKLGLDRVDPFEVGEPFPCAHKRHRKVIRRTRQSDPVYAAMVENMDWNIGRILDALDRAGKRDNTLVIFTSDNGGLATSEGSPTCNAPLAEGKGWMYEGGTREPLLIRWPEVIAPGQVSEEPVTSTDFFPTILEAAQIETMPERHEDGVSLLPLLQGSKDFARGPLFWHYPHYSNQGGTPGCSIRDGDWKLIEFFEDGKRELYHLRHDPGEVTDQSESEPERTQDLHQRLVAWRESVEALIPKPNQKWSP